MRATLATLSVILLPVAVIGVREEVSLASEQKVNRSWQKKVYEFCLGSEAEIECDGDEGQVMKIASAHYNRNKKVKGKECAPYTSKTKSCETNAQKVVVHQCQGTQICHMLPEDHVQCEEAQPFWKMRLVIECSVGEPREEPKRPHCTEDNPCDQETDLIEDELDTESVGKKSHITSEMAIHLLSHDLESAPASTTSGKPVYIMNVMAQKAVKQKVQKEVETEDLVALSFVPCFRHTRMEKLGNWEVFGDWSHYEILARLTNCGHNEGCFQLAFDDHRVYTGFENRPEPHNLVEGKLATGKDSLWVTWQGIGLLRNDWNTWGVCLPKSSTIQYAIALWDHLRSGGLPGDVELA